MHLFRTILTCCLCATAALWGAGPEWKPYHSIVGNFKVLLPGRPVWTGTNLSVPGSSLTIAYDSFLLEKSDDTVFLISVAHYPQEVDLEDSSSVLMEALDGLISSDPSHILVGSKFGTHTQGFPSLSFHIRAAGSDTHLKGQQILVGQKLFLAVVISESDADLRTDVDQFLGSLSITDIQLVQRHKAQLI